MSTFNFAAFDRFGGIVDVRNVTDPYGLGITIPVLRDGDPEWADLPQIRSLKNEPVAFMAQAGIQLQSAARNPEANVDGMAEQATSRALASMDSERLVRLLGVAHLPAREINDLKYLVAKVLMTERGGRQWSGVIANGEPVPYTLANRLHFLGWDGVILTHTNGQPQQVMSRGAFAAITADSALGKGVASGRISAEEFAGNPRTESGDLRMIPAELPYGDRPVGDALMLWLLDAAKQNQGVFAEVTEGVAEVFTESPSGESATSAD